MSPLTVEGVSIFELFKEGYVFFFIEIPLCMGYSLDLSMNEVKGEDAFRTSHLQQSTGQSESQAQG